MDWKPGYLKLFMSHRAPEKAFVGKVREALLTHGIDGFVAHEDIQVSKQWQREIEKALSECESMAVFLHSHPELSAWVEQEIGFGLAFGVAMVTLKFGPKTDPGGFLGELQAAQCSGLYPAKVADIIALALLEDSRTSEKAQNGLIHALRVSETFSDTRLIVGRFDRIEDFDTDERQYLLERAMDNFQVSGERFGSGARVRRLLGEGVATAD